MANVSGVGEGNSVVLSEAMLECVCMWVENSNVCTKLCMKPKVSKISKNLQCEEILRKQVEGLIVEGISNTGEKTDQQHASCTEPSYHTPSEHAAFHFQDSAVMGEYWGFSTSFHDYATQHIANNLYAACPMLILWQKVFLLSISLGAIICAIVNYELLVSIFLCASHTLFLSLSLFKIFTVIRGRVLNKEIDDIKGVETGEFDELPYYSILIPVYQEEIMLPNTIRNIASISYPKHKLQILIILEVDDELSRSAIQKIELPSFFSVIYVPKTYPRTKAKACNYALQYVYGEFVTIFDAEDKPNVDQLLKAVKVFRNKPEVACLQAKLCYYNSTENLLTTMFDMEYRFFFSYAAPAVVSVNCPLPLGGSSNHFRTSLLRYIGGWDNYNVTEDAELGIRMSVYNLRTEILSSYTEEESPITLKPWLKQRARWMKGHLLTYIVYLRHPCTIMKKLTLKGFLMVGCVIGIPQISLIVSVLFFVLMITNHNIPICYHSVGQGFFTLHFFSAISSILGFVSIFLSAWVVTQNSGKILKRFLLSCCFFFYFILHAIAAYIALFELFTKPYHWNKTKHGVSAYFQQKKNMEK